MISNGGKYRNVSEWEKEKQRPKPIKCLQRQRSTLCRNTVPKEEETRETAWAGVEITSNSSMVVFSSWTFKSFCVSSSPGSWPPTISFKYCWSILSKAAFRSFLKPYRRREPEGCLSGNLTGCDLWSSADIKYTPSWDAAQSAECWPNMHKAPQYPRDESWEVEAGGPDESVQDQPGLHENLSQLPLPNLTPKSTLHVKSLSKLGTQTNQCNILTLVSLKS